LFKTQKIGAAPKNLEGHTSWVYSVAFSRDGKVVASASSDRMVRLWNTATSAALQTLKHTSWAMSIAFSRDGKVMGSASSDKTVQL
jgi:WD40 repeat protein